MARQRAIAQETLDVYAPLAHRLGVQQVKWQLEDLSFATLHPKRYAEIEQMVAARQPEREDVPREVMATLSAKLDEFGIKAEVRGRPKHLWSIYEKMVDRRQGVRRDLRPRGSARHRRRGTRLLGRARRDPRAVVAGPGSVQGLHQLAQVQPLPVAAHDGHRPAGQVRSRSRFAPRRCTGAPSSASRRTGATRRAPRARESPGCSASPTSKRKRTTRSPSSRP